jgi:cytidyltransferase-like protein
VKAVVVFSSLGNLRSRDVRFLEEASRLGNLHVLLLSDECAKKLEGKAPTFPLEERRYFVEAIRYVDRVTSWTGPCEPDALPEEYATLPAVWAVDEVCDTVAKRDFCSARGLEYHRIGEAALQEFPEAVSTVPERPSGRKKVIVTGCYDWFHSGHVRFFEEVSELGDLYVVVGHDANIQLLKGEGHPMFRAEERRYLAGSIRHVKQALVSTGHGWLDAEPEIERIQPDIYAVNEDGDRPEKREYCDAHGIEYRVLRRLPREGLPKRQSTELRGF